MTFPEHPPRILVISSSEDEHARMVLQQLEYHNAPATLLDLSDFPQSMALAVTYNREIPQNHYLVDGSGRKLSFAECRVVWWRRPQNFKIHSDLQNQVDYSFAYSESHAAFSGLWLTLDAFWINHPLRDEAASRKVFQLQVAQEVGLAIPVTCITNSPPIAHAFIEEHGIDNVIYKAFTGTQQAWRETRVLRVEELQWLGETLPYAPVIFQEYIPALCDLRITVIGEHVFPAAIYSQETEYHADFRMAMDEARVEAFSLPAEVTDQLRQLMKRFGLVYGAIDMRLTPEGRYVFLEINPAGQWLFVEFRTGQPITETFASLLLERSRITA